MGNSPPGPNGPTVTDGLGIVLNSVDEVTKAFETLADQFKTFTDGILKGTSDLDDFARTVSLLVSETEKLTATFTGAAALMSGIFPDDIGDRAKQGLESLNATLKIFGESTSLIVNMVNILGKTLDSVTNYSRGLTKELYEATKAYGLDIDGIAEYREVLNSMLPVLASASTGWMGLADAREAMAGMASAGIPLERMKDTIVSTRGETNLLVTAFLQSKALGMDLGKYFNLLSNAMNVQGLSTQKAVEQMAMFEEVSRKTGFTIEKVAGHLQGIADGFSKLGMTAEFGRPLLEGFTNSLTSMGFGFENALELSKELSQSIAGLASNYATAYLTFQRGGLDINTSGTALGAGIGMQARMIRAKEEGTEGELALDIAGAMKDTLASMTGGRIVTLQEAEGSPELEALYFTQTEMLKSLYNISDTGSQARTLEMLQQLGESSADGDANLAEAIGKEMESAASYQDKTLSIQEKSARILETIAQRTLDLNQTYINTAQGLSNDFTSGLTSVSDKIVEQLKGMKFENTPPTPNPAGSGGASGSGGSSGGGGGNRGGDDAAKTNELSAKALDVATKALAFAKDSRGINNNGRRP